MMVVRMVVAAARRGELSGPLLFVSTTVDADADIDGDDDG